MHELLHLRIRNHGWLFKAALSVHLPGVDGAPPHEMSRAVIRS